MIEAIPATQDGRVLHSLYGETMGTRWRVELCAARKAPLDALHDGIQRRLDDIVAQMSTWESASDLCRFNRAAAGSWHVLPQSFFDVLSCACDIARASEGAFDPTVAPLVAEWGFGADAGASLPPSPAAVEVLRSRVGWQRIALDAASRSALQPGGASLDLSAIAKGFAADDVAAWLRNAGVSAALVDVGGELAGYGRKPDGTPWRVLVETGYDDDAAPCVVVLDGMAVATSGTRWFRYRADGREYAHTIDPRSGRPIEDAPAAVTVIAGSAMWADGWATALTVMGLGAGLDYALDHGLAARFVASARGAGAQTRTTPAFDALVANR